jgi:predicted Fe-Mo cluster-binding NifX family protein
MKGAEILNKTIAVPSMFPGGLDSQWSGHFGQCDVFTLVQLEDNAIREISVVQNPPHVDGGCLAPVMMLRQNGADALIVGGIGMRPLMGFRQVGIDVYFGTEGDTVSQAIEHLIQGKLQLIGDEQVCGGGCAGHH